MESGLTSRERRRACHSFQQPLLLAGPLQHKRGNNARLKYWEIIADNLSKAGWSLGVRLSD